MGGHAGMYWLGIGAIRRRGRRGVRTKALVREGSLSLSGRGWRWWMGEHVIWGMLGDIHFIIIESMHGEVIGRMLCDRLIEMGG
jgi:hypothetical protein